MKIQRLLLVLAGILFMGAYSSVHAQTFFNISASDTSETPDNEREITNEEDQRFTVSESSKINASPLALALSGGGNFNLPSKDPNKRNPDAPPPLSSSEITPEENATYQALINFLQTCLFNPPGSETPGISQSSALLQDIPRVIQTSTEIEKEAAESNN